MATGAGLLQAGPCCVNVSCTSSSSQNRVSGSLSVALPSYVKIDGSGMKFRERPGLLRGEEMMKALVTAPVVAGAAPRRFDAFEEPSASDWETEELTDENAPQSWDKQEISPEAGAIVLSSSSSTSLQSLSKDAAMGIILSAAGSTAGWTTGSGLEGPAYSMKKAASEMPGPILSKSPRRRMRVAFTCNVCGHRSIRAINPHAYTDGTVFVQCEGCDVYHKLVDNLKLFHELKGRIYRGYECLEVGFDQYYDFLG